MTRRHVVILAVLPSVRAQSGLLDLTTGRLR